MSHPTTTERRALALLARLSACVLLAALLAASSPARAALIPLSFEELTHKSQHVITGKVVRLRSYYEELEELGTVIFTDVTIRVSGRIMGAFTGKEMTLKVPGGIVGRVRQVWAEASEFTEGELVLVFVSEVRNRLMVTGWRQGKYRLSTDGATVLGRGDLPIGRSTALSTVRSQVGLFEATRPPASARPAASTAEEKR